jgi:ParB family chromosome partitioning protein
MDEAQAVTYEKGKLYNIALSDLHVDPKQPRKFIDPIALEELSASIIQHGVLEPILFRRDVEGFLYIVAGERRFAAARNAGIATIPAILVDGKHSEIALVENLLRQDLTAVEEAEALDRLMKDESYTQEQLGGIIGKARTTVTDILTLNRLPQEIRDECRGNTTVTRKTLITIARNKQVRSMITAWNKVKEKQAKENAGGQRKQPTVLTPEAQCEWMIKTNAKLAAIDSTTWTPEERTAFTTALGELKKTILAIMLKTKTIPQI